MCGCAAKIHCLHNWPFEENACNDGKSLAQQRLKDNQENGFAKLLTLTLIDLPGLAKVAVEGQAESIVQDIENMVRSYVVKIVTQWSSTTAPKSERRALPLTYLAAGWPTRMTPT